MSKEFDIDKTDEYIERLNDVTESFQKYGIEAIRGELSPKEINYNLANWMNWFLTMSAEYCRKKLEHTLVETEFKQWWNIILHETRNVIEKEYEEKGRKTSKPAVSEVEKRAKAQFQDYYIKDADVKAKEFILDHYKRVMDKFEKHATNLTILSSNMKSEMNKLNLS